MKPITEAIAAKVLETVDAGLCSGLGKPTPGAMCVEAAVCYALGQKHGDQPTCVSPALREYKIKLNDANWSSNVARAKGMRRLALVQLGTAGTLDEKAFAVAISEMTIRVVVPIALRAAVSNHQDQKHKDAMEACAIACEQNPCRETADAAAYAADAAAYAANAAAYAAANAAANAAAAYAADAANAAANAAADAAANAAANAARDTVLSTIAEAAVQVLIKLGAAGTQWLALTE